MTTSLKRFVLIPLFVVGFFQNSCDNDDNGNGACQDTICTAILQRININVVDADQNPVALDAFEVINTKNNQEVTIILSQSEFEGTQEFGLYPLIEDGMLGLNEEVGLQFKGFINGIEVLQADYIVQTDCCHVSLKSGEQQLVF